MFKVLNVSERSLMVGGFRIAPLEYHIFDSNVISNATRNKINSLSNLGLIKVLAIENHTEPTQSGKKSSRKSK